MCSPTSVLNTQSAIGSVETTVVMADGDVLMGITLTSLHYGRA